MPPEPTEPPSCGDGQELSPPEAAILLGVTEDEVLIRQGRGELPVLLTMATLAADVPEPGDPDPTLRPVEEPEQQP